MAGRILTVVSTCPERLDDDGVPLSLGTFTDLAVLRLSGSSVEARGDHLVIRTPANPDFHWGNFVYVTDPGRVDEAAHWLSVFEEAIPGAEHRAFGLIAAPSASAGATAWHGAGLELEQEDALSTTTLPALRPLPAGYTARELSSDDDWAQALLLEDGPDGGTVDPQHRRFRERRLGARRVLAKAGHATFVGAFEDSQLVARLGIVNCGRGVARYQDVITAPQHRRRGLTSHLLGFAARWAGDCGCNRWVILADANSNASRLYQACGFTDIERLTQAYRARATGGPPRTTPAST